MLLYVLYISKNYPIMQKHNNSYLFVLFSYNKADKICCILAEFNNVIEKVLPKPLILFIKFVGNYAPSWFGEDNLLRANIHLIYAEIFTSFLEPKKCLGGL